MMKVFAAAVLTAALVLPAAAQAPNVPAPAQPPQQIINLSLMEALITVERVDMAGVFSFVPEVNTPLAFADYLLRSLGSLKRFIKKCRKDYKVAQGISEWDKQVLLYIVGLNPSSVALGFEQVPEGRMKEVGELCMLPGIPLQVIVQRRGK